MQLLSIFRVLSVLFDYNPESYYGKAVALIPRIKSRRSPLPHAGLPFLPFLGRQEWPLRRHPVSKSACNFLVILAYAPPAPPFL